MRRMLHSGGVVMEWALFILCVLLVLTAFYFMPSIIAYDRRVLNWRAILALNTFLGWTLVGWTLALIWALKRDADSPA